MHSSIHHSRTITSLVLAALHTHHKLFEATTVPVLLRNPHTLLDNLTLHLGTATNGPRMPGAQQRRANGVFERLKPLSPAFRAKVDSHLRNGSVVSLGGFVLLRSLPRFAHVLQSPSWQSSLLGHQDYHYIWCLGAFSLLLLPHLHSTAAPPSRRKQAIRVASRFCSTLPAQPPAEASPTCVEAHSLGIPYNSSSSTHSDMSCTSVTCDCPRQRHTEAHQNGNTF